MTRNTSNDDVQPVVIVRRTGVDDQLVMWHLTVGDATTAGTQVLTASATGVRTGPGVTVDEVPEAWLAAAMDAAAALAADPRADVSRFATHRNDVVENGPLVPIDRAQG